MSPARSDRQALCERPVRPPRSGRRDPEFHWDHDSSDLGQFLDDPAKKNVIAAPRDNYGVDTYSCPAQPGGFLLQAEIDSAESAPLVIATDETWRVKPADEWDFNSPRIAPGLGFQEVYDSRRKPVGWNVVGFDDSGWEEPEVIGEAAFENLVAREIHFPAGVERLSRAGRRQRMGTARR